MQREDARMRILEPNIEVLDNVLKQENDVFNQWDDMAVDDLDVARRILKDEVDIHMDGFNSDEDEVRVREGKIIRLEDEVPMGQGSED